MLVYALPWVLAIKLLTYRVFGLRHMAWRHIGFEDLLRIVSANAAASLFVAGTLRALIGPAFPRSIYILDGLLCVVLDAGTRAVIRILFDLSRSPLRPGVRRVLIYGAGQAGVTLLNEFRRQPEPTAHVAGFLDDDPSKRDMRLHGVRVFGGRQDLLPTVSKLFVDEVLIALPTASGNDITEILARCHQARVSAKRVPALSEILENKILADQIREVRIEDLLGRPPVRLEDGPVRTQIEGQIVLVTGAGGSIGSELCRQIARHAPAAIVGLDQAETALYEIEQELQAAFPGLLFCPEIGSVQNRTRLDEVLEHHRPRAIYHAAAYKHVPMMEAHLFEAVENNVFGTRNVARAAACWGVRELVVISSDKAVRPANIMGATKRAAELVSVLESSQDLKTVAVRFGNVLGSNGSVIPRFRQQIARGGPVTVTHPEMRRFFMTIPEAAQLVLQAGAMGLGGEIFVLEMGEPVRILDLARKMILLSGLRPEVDIPIRFSGLRPGEKMYEELSAYEENTTATGHRQIRVLTGAAPDREALAREFEQLRDAVHTRDSAGAVMALKELVPEYNPSTGLLRSLLQEKAHSVVA
ncbi:MAG: nucleoside-diphosphate sugar epimerase/dehydratase [Acidobacteriota bacterium]